MDTTNASHPGCPCFPDYPQIGADQYGFYISSNEFDFAMQFVDASILAISKASLAAGVAQPTAFQFLLPFNTYEFAIHPATTPPGASYFLQNGGVEYFVSSQAANPDSTMAIFAMSNTSSLATATPNLTLTETLVQTLAYQSPPASHATAERPDSPGQSLGFTFPRPVDGGDTRLQSVVYSGGRLYVTLGTQVVDSQQQLLAGGAYVVISIANRGGQITASALRQGYLLVNGNHLLRPAIAVDALGPRRDRGHAGGSELLPVFRHGAILGLRGRRNAANGRARATLPDDGFTAYDVPFYRQMGRLRRGRAGWRWAHLAGYGVYPNYCE